VRGLCRPGAWRQVLPVLGVSDGNRRCPPHPADRARHLPARAIRELGGRKAITAERDYDADQIQPASLDLRLGARAWRIRASFLPSAKTPVTDRLEDLALHPISLNGEGTVLETGCVYIVEVEERLALPADIAAATNPKSSTGRLDIFTRVIGDRVAAFDTIPAGIRASSISRLRRARFRFSCAAARGFRRSASAAAKRSLT
jgi:hypothetical protein